MDRIVRGLWQWRWERKASREGKADGKVNVPNNDRPKAPPFQGKVEKRGVGRSHRVGNAWLRRDRRATAKHRKLHDREVPLRERLADARARLTERQENAAEIKRRAADERDEQRQQGRGGIHREWSFQKRTFWLLALVLAVAEYPLNRLVFAKLDRGSSFGGYLISAGVLVLVLAAGKLIGILSHRASKSKGDRVALVWTLIVTALALAACVGLSLFRVDYAAKRFDTLREVVEQAAGDDSGAALTLPAPPNRGIATLMFMGINVLSLAVSAGFSFLAHDPADDLAKRGLAGARRKVDKASKALAKAEAKCRAGGAARARRFEAACAEDDEWRQRFLAVISAYWVHNLRARIDAVSVDLSELATAPVDLPLAEWRTRTYIFDFHPPSDTPMALVTPAAA